MHIVNARYFHVPIAGFMYIYVLKLKCNINASFAHHNYINVDTQQIRSYS